MSPPDENANIASHLPAIAQRQPDVPALKVPRGRAADGSLAYLSLTFRELEQEVAAWQQRLRKVGVGPGDRVLVMVRPGLPLIASVFALFATGAVPIVIDPGMGRKAFLACVARSRPRVLLGIPLARALSHVFRTAFRSLEVRVPASGRPTARLAPIGPGSGPPLEVAARARDDLAAILFTSGSTGAPKGVRYEHGMFAAQVELIRRTYDLQPGEIDLPMLPVFALFNPALGMTTVVPEIDPSRPASVNPAQIVRAIQQERVTNAFGSPTLWLKIARYCRDHRQTLPSLKRVLSAGAPVPPALWQLLQDVMPNGELHSPYGATEALPVATIAAREVISTTASRTLAGAGTCVGRVIPPNDVRIIALSDQPLPSLASATELPAGRIGEIIVRGPTVTRAYDDLPEATRRTKIPAGAATTTDTGVYHRLGDCGYLDEEGRLWFCGRAVERVTLADGSVLYPEQVEPVFNHHDQVARSALIGLGPPGDQRAALVVEPRDSHVLRTTRAQRELGRELRQLASGHRFAGTLRLFYFHPGLPVDVRHNAKIHRLALARWAATTRGLEIDPKR